MGYMIEAVTEEKSTFMSSVMEIASFLMSLLSSDSMKNEDPQSSAIKECMIRISYFLKEDSHQFMSVMLPSILRDTTLDIDIKSESASLPKTSDNDAFVYKTKGMEDQTRVTMNTSALEAKILAFKMLSSFSESMEKAFAPYIDTVLPVVVNGMNYTFSKSIRKNSMLTIVHISAFLEETMALALFNKLFPAFMNLI